MDLVGRRNYTYLEHLLMSIQFDLGSVYSSFSFEEWEYVII